ncbi:unnamed protein product [Ceutorhynchus assimilis]|uniref:BZIP domain-containing protein n=1 Tax=Ceutorhynchus assimilis TaxID=467358 RepID=A0A9N9MD36_9CUCU|nr:unnamed protein product [Ceutorhynchus assimilis]
MIPMAHMNYYNNNYKQVPADYVLDLSVKTKRVSSPDYTYGYPSPKFSPTECLKHSPLGSPTLEVQMDMSLSPNEVYSSSPCLSSPKSTQSETSYQSSDIDSSPRCKRKPSRPFKSMPQESMALSTTIIDQLDCSNSTAFIIDNQEIGPEETKRLIEDSARKYAEFREKMLTQLSNNNNTNLNMRRMQNNGIKAQDEEYLEKRRKNNQAAKRSRDARRNKQDEIAIRASFLEQENIMLKYKVKSEIEDLERLRQMELASSTPASL